MRDFAIITVLDNITETSMPWNEFVLYRYNHNKKQKQYVIVCDSPSDNVPNDLDVTFTGRSLSEVTRAMRRIIAECKENKIDYAVHLHQSKSALKFNLATLFLGLSRKTIFTVHSQFPAYNFKNKLASLFNAMLAKRVNCVSRTAYEVYPSFIKKIKKDRMKYIENGVDIERIDHTLSKHIEKQRTKKRFVYVARMIPLKKHDFLLDVFKEVRGEYELLFIGSEDADGKIRKLVDAYGIADKVTFAGLIPRDQLFDKLADCDAYVSSSTIEGLPVSVLEAMAVGLPAIISDIKPHKEISKECSCIETLPFDKSVWAERMEEIICEEKSELLKRGAVCRDTVISKFSLATMHKRYLEEYQLLLK